MAAVSVTESKFAMWRAAVSLAHSDQRLVAEEIALIKRYSENFGFSPEQRAQLEADLVSPIDIDDIFPAITDKLDRAHLINFSRLLFFTDGEFAPVEEKTWDALNDKHNTTIDFKQALIDARSARDAWLAEDQARLDSEKQRGGWVNRLFAYFSGWNDDAL